MLYSDKRVASEKHEDGREFILSTNNQGYELYWRPNKKHPWYLLFIIRDNFYRIYQSKFCVRQIYFIFNKLLDKNPAYNWPISIKDKNEV